VQGNVALSSGGGMWHRVAVVFSQVDGHVRLYRRIIIGKDYRMWR